MITLFLALVQFISGPGGGAVAAPPVSPFALVNHVAVGTPSGNCNLTSGTSSAIATTGATLEVIGVSSFSTTPTVSDSLGNTWIALPSQGSAGTIYPFYCAPCTVGASQTFSFGNGGSNSCMVAAAFSGANASPLDVDNGALFVAPPSQGLSVTPSHVNSLVVSFIASQAGTCFSMDTIDSGMTITDTAGGFPSAGQGAAMAYIIETAIVAKNPIWTQSMGAPAGCTGGVENVVFKQ